MIESGITEQGLFDSLESVFSRNAPENSGIKFRKIFFLTFENLEKWTVETLKTAALQWFSAFLKGRKFLQKKC